MSNYRSEPSRKPSARRPLVYESASDQNLGSSESSACACANIASTTDQGAPIASARLGVPLAGQEAARSEDGKHHGGVLTDGVVSP